MELFRSLTQRTHVKKKGRKETGDISTVRRFESHRARFSFNRARFCYFFLRYRCLPLISFTYSKPSSINSVASSVVLATLQTKLSSVE
jgi:hypothetical protein